MSDPFLLIEIVRSLTNFENVFIETLWAIVKIRRRILTASQCHAQAKLPLTGLHFRIVPRSGDNTTSNILYHLYTQLEMIRVVA